MEKVEYVCDTHEQAERLREHIKSFDWDKEVCTKENDEEMELVQNPQGEYYFRVKDKKEE